MAKNREVTSRNVGMNPDNIFDMLEKQPEQPQSGRGFDRSSWFKSPLEKLVIEEPGIYTFDVLGFKISTGYHPFWAKRNYYDVPDLFWFDLPVSVHEAFGVDTHPMVCSRTFGAGKNGYDSVCKFLWDNKEEYDYRKFGRNYAVFVIRMHPNATIGNTDYKFFTYTAGKGVFAKALYEEYQTCIDAKDRDNMAFFKYDETGKTIKARFAKTSKVLDGKQVEWLECNKIDFIDRKDQLTDQDVEMLLSLDIVGCLTKPTEDTYKDFVNKISGNFTRVEPERDGFEPTRTSSIASSSSDDIPW